MSLSISAFFPAYNDLGTIGEIVQTAARLLSEVSDDFEVVVVDDGSSDGTGDLLRRLAREHPFLRVIHHGVNRGYGAALITGFANCRKDLIFYTDGDGQYDVWELKRLVEHFGNGVDVVNGYKIRRSDPLYRAAIGRMYHHTVSLLFGLKMRDVDCDFRLFRRNILDRIRLSYDSGVICVEMMKKFRAAGCRLVEVPVHHYPRRSGSSQFFRPRHLFRVFRQLFTLWLDLVIKRNLLQPEMPAPARPLPDL